MFFGTLPGEPLLVPMATYLFGGTPGAGLPGTSRRSPPEAAPCISRSPRSLIGDLGTRGWCLLVNGVALIQASASILS